MSKIKLTKVLKEAIEQENKKQKALQKVVNHRISFTNKLEAFKERLRKDGYNV